MLFINSTQFRQSYKSSAFTVVVNKLKYQLFLQGSSKACLSHHTGQHHRNTPLACPLQQQVQQL